MHTVPHSLAFPDCVPPQSHNHFLFPSEDRGGGPTGQGQGCSSTPGPPRLLPQAQETKRLCCCPLCFHHLFSSSVEIVCLQREESL